MHSQLAAFAVLIAAVSAQLQLESFNPGFFNAGRQGCISASDNVDGSPVVIHDCNTEDVSKHTWELSLFTRQPAGPQPIKIFGNKCLDVVGGVDADGTKLQIWTCDPVNPNQQWTSQTDFTFKWNGGSNNRCIDLPDGNVNDGNQLQIWECVTGSQNQGFSGNRVPDTQDPAVRVVGGPPSPDREALCLTAESNTDGAPVAIANCSHFDTLFPSGNQTWAVPVNPLNGQIKTYDGTKCLDVPNGDLTNGNKLQIWTCTEGNTNQLWRADSPNTISLAGKNKCVDITNGNLTAGNQLQIWDCDSSNSNQGWFVTEF